MSFWYRLRCALAAPHRRNFFRYRFIFSVFAMAISVSIHDYSMALALRHDAYMAGFSSVSDYQAATRENIHTPEEWFAYNAGLQLVVLGTRAQIISSDHLTEEARQPQQQARQRHQELQATEEQERKAAQCRANLACWGKLAASAASGECSDRIEREAAYDYIWTNWIWQSRFSEYRWENQTEGTVILMGNYLKFQNIFGAWSYRNYECTVDPINNLVVSTSVSDRFSTSEPEN